MVIYIWYLFFSSGGKRRTRKELSIEDKLEIISAFESGRKPARIAQGKGRGNESSIRKIIKRKEELKKCSSFALWSIQN